MNQAFARNPVSSEELREHAGKYRGLRAEKRECKSLLGERTLAFSLRDRCRNRQKPAPGNSFADRGKQDSRDQSKVQDKSQEEGKPRLRRQGDFQDVKHSYN